MDKRALEDTHWERERRRVDARIKERMHGERTRRGMTAAAMAEEITNNGYRIFRNLENNTDRSARVNRPLIMAFCRAMSLPDSALIRPDEWAYIPERASVLNQGRRTRTGMMRAKKDQDAAILARFRKEHKQDPDDMDCCTCGGLYDECPVAVVLYGTD